MATTIIYSGQTSSGLSFNTDDTIYVSGGTITDFTIASGAVINVEWGGTANNTHINNGGVQSVLFSGTTNSTNIYLGGIEAVNGSAINANVYSGGVQIVSGPFGKTTNTIVYGGGVQSAIAGATTGTIILAEGSQIVTSGGYASTTIVSNGGIQTISNGRTLSTTVFSGGKQYVSRAGIASNTTISQGGYQYIDAYGGGIGTVIDGGVQSVIAKGSAFSTIVNDGGIQYVSAGANVSETIVNDGGVQSIFFGALATSTTINSGGMVTNDGLLYHADVRSGGNLNGGIVSGSILVQGVTSGVSVISNSVENVLAGGKVIDTTISSGGRLLAASGAILAGITTVEMGGSAIIAPDVGGTINLVGDANHGLFISGFANAGSVTSVTTVISGFNGAGPDNSDSISLEGVLPNDIVQVEYPDADHVTFTLKNGNTITLNIIGARDAGYTLNRGYTYVRYEVCFLTGSMIRTSMGEIAVEDIRINDSVITFDWKHKQHVSCPVRWVGSKQVKVKPELVEDMAGYPVRVLKNAIADGVPYKDLLITPEHCLFFDGKFIPVRMLVNGASIYYDRSVTEYTYYHIETEEHSVIYADGMLTESYLDTGNRHQFKQDGNLSILRCAYEPKNWEKDASAMLTVDRTIVEPIYNDLVNRANSILGCLNIPEVEAKDVTMDPDLHIITNTGLTIEPLYIRNNQYSFLLPDDVQEIYLSSRVSRPCDVIGSFVDDRRYLGVLVGQIYILTSNQIYSLTDHLTQEDLSGWDVIEEAPCRWTNGKGLLTINHHYPEKRILTVQVLSSNTYVVNQEKEGDILKIA